MSDTKKIRIESIADAIKNGQLNFEQIADIYQNRKISWDKSEYTWASAPCQAFSGTKNETIDIDYEEVKDETEHTPKGLPNPQH